MLARKWNFKHFRTRVRFPDGLLTIVVHAERLVAKGVFAEGILERKLPLWRTVIHLLRESFVHN